MTVVAATNLLFEWFIKEDSFELEQDINKLILVSDHPNRDKAAVMASLEELSTKEIVAKSSVEGRCFWILKQPFSTYNQTVEIPPMTALAISDLINNFCEVIQDDTDVCDSTNIMSKDINNIVLITEHLSSMNKDQENID